MGIVTAAHAGRTYRTSATSIFFLMGQSGLALGPIISGIVLQRMGLAGLPYIALAMTPAVIMMALYLRDPIIEEKTTRLAAVASDTRLASASARKPPR